MSIPIAMPRMSTDPELTTAQSKYVESLARAGASVRWVELADPDKAVAEALPDIIRWYADNGYTFLTVAEALPLN